MSDRRVVYLSQISTGSKFRLVANRVAAAATAKKSGVHWASCVINNPGGNFVMPFSPKDPSDPSMRPHYETRMLGFNWVTIKVYPPKFNIFNKPCPRAIGYNFPQRGGPGTGLGHGYSLLPLNLDYLAPARNRRK